MNHVDLIGRMTAAPELKYAQTGTAFCNFTLAVDKGLSKDKKAELQAQGKPTANFIRCKGVGKTAENIAQYFDKGSQIAITGEIETSKYTTQSGETRYSTDVFIQKFYFIGSNKESQPSQQGDSNFSQYSPDDFQGIDDDPTIPF